MGLKFGLIMVKSIEIYDQPAIIRGDGSQEWLIHGVYHRDGDQPAVIDSKRN